MALSKGPNSNCFRPCRWYMLRFNYSTLSSQHKSSYRCYVGKWAGSCSHKTIDRNRGRARVSLRAVVGRSLFWGKVFPQPYRELRQAGSLSWKRSPVVPEGAIWVQQWWWGQRTGSQSRAVRTRRPREKPSTSSRGHGRAGWGERPEHTDQRGEWCKGPKENITTLTWTRLPWNHTHNRERQRASATKKGAVLEEWC